MKAATAPAVVLSFFLFAPANSSCLPDDNSLVQDPAGALQQPSPTPPAGAAPSPAPPQEPAPPPRPRSPQQEEELRADILMARKQYSEAAEIYNNLLRQEPRNAILLNKLGIAFHQQGNLSQAKRYYDRSSRADRTYANPVNNVGTVHYQRKKYRKAVDAYKKALAIQPRMTTTHSNLGYALFALKRYEEALESFGRALQLDPTIFEHSQSSGTVLQDRSVRDPGLFYYFVAKSFAQMGDAKRCAQFLRKARDEGYKGFTAAQTDPAFSKVLEDPEVREVLQLPSPVAAVPQNPPDL